MIARRTLISGGAVAALAATAGARTAGMTTAAGARDEREVKQVVDAINEIANELRAQRNSCSTGTCPVVVQLRAQQQLFLKANQKFPDFIEVGIDVWDRVTDWHIVNRLPLNISRMTDGRYVMSFLQTTLLLRPEAANEFVGYGYDAK